MNYFRAITAMNHAEPNISQKEFRTRLNAFLRRRGLVKTRWLEARENIRQTVRRRKAAEDALFDD